MKLATARALILAMVPWSSLAGCKFETVSEGPPTGALLDAGTQDKFGVVTGRVFSAKTMVPVAGARIAVQGAEAISTGNDGHFSVPHALAGERTVVQVSGQNIVASARTVKVAENQASYVELFVTEALASQQFDLAQGGTLTATSGVQVTVAPNALVKKDGTPVEGQVEISVAPLDPRNPSQLAAFPGDFAASRADGTSLMLETVSPMDITAVAGGQPLTVAPGQTVDVSFPVYDVSTADPTVELWSLDPATSTWQSEGVAQLTVNGTGTPVYKAQVKHFSWWNVDKSLVTQACVRGRVTRKGKPAANIAVQATGVDHKTVIDALTDDKGTFAFSAKQGGQLSVVAKSRGELSEPITLTPKEAGDAKRDVSRCVDAGTLELKETAPLATDCPTSYERCGATCVATKSDPAHCGACGNSCQKGTQCIAGTCACADSQSLCGGVCISVLQDSKNCGSCGNVCGDGQFCRKGECQKIVCTTGYAVCPDSGNVCVDLMASKTNCGECGRKLREGEICKKGVPTAINATGDGGTTPTSGDCRGVPDLVGPAVATEDLPNPPDLSGGKWLPGKYVLMKRAVSGGLIAQDKGEFQATLALTDAGPLGSGPAFALRRQWRSAPGAVPVVDQGTGTWNGTNATVSLRFDCPNTAQETWTYQTFLSKDGAFFEIVVQKKRDTGSIYELYVPVDRQGDCFLPGEGKACADAGTDGGKDATKGDASPADATLVDGTILDAGVVDAKVPDATVYDATVLDATLGSESGKDASLVDASTRDGGAPNDGAYGSEAGDATTPWGTTQDGSFSDASTVASVLPPMTCSLERVATGTAPSPSTAVNPATMLWEGGALVPGIYNLTAWYQTSTTDGGSSNNGPFPATLYLHTADPLRPTVFPYHLVHGRSDGRFKGLVSASSDVGHLETSNTTKGLLQRTFQCPTRDAQDALYQVKKEYVGTEVFTKLIVGTDLDAKATPNTAFVFTKCDRCVGLVAPLACLGKDGPAPAMDPDATMYAPLRGSNCDLAALPVAATEFKDGLPSAMPGTFRMYDRKQFACDGLSLQKTVRLENVFGTNITRLSQLARSPDAQGEAQDTVLTFQTNGTSRMEIPCSNPVATAPTAVRWAPSSNNGKPGFVLMYDGKVQEFYEDVGSVGRVGNATCPATCTQPSDCALCGGGSTCSRGACTTASTGTLSTPSTGTLSTTP